MKEVNTSKGLPDKLLKLLKQFNKSSEGITHYRAYNVPMARKKSGYTFAQKGIVYNICPFYCYKKGYLKGAK